MDHIIIPVIIFWYMVLIKMTTKSPYVQNQKTIKKIFETELTFGFLVIRILKLLSKNLTKFQILC